MVTLTHTRADFNDGPFVVFYEVTQACDPAVGMAARARRAEPGR
jgi:hypothetical protein